MDGQDSSGCPEAAASITHRICRGTLKVIVSGPVGLQDVTAYVTRHQEIWAAHDKVLWDLRQFNPSGVSSADILNIRHAFGEIIDMRAGGRSAVLVSKDLNLVVRVAMALREDRDFPLEMRSFLDEAEALSWLDA
jgi:hypothetical protein